MHNATPKHLLFILTKVDVFVCRTEIRVPFRQGHPWKVWRFLKNEHGAIFSKTRVVSLFSCEEYYITVLLSRGKGS